MRDARRVTARGWMAAAAFLFAGTQAWAADAAAPIPVEAFFQKPSIAYAAISPTGRHLALTSLSKDDTLQLVIVDTAKLTAKMVASFQRADVVRVHWVSEKRLVFGAEDSEHQLSDRMTPTCIAAALNGWA